MSAFEERIGETLSLHGYKRRSSVELLKWWTDFVGQCVDGYDWTIYEYDDEIGVRDYLECLLQDSGLKTFGEFNSFRKAIEEIDEQFRTVLQTNVDRPTDSPHWWRKGVLKFAGDEYRDDMESRYSIVVDGY
ncbi:hypothetical protein SH449x_002960 [Pirellulaceae bacterium SH449]